MRACWEAPGRVNLIGEHLDYNGGQVLPFALDMTTRAEVTTTSDPRIRIASEGFGHLDVGWPLRRDDVEQWARYIAGAVWAFTDLLPDLLVGLDIQVSSTVPVGAGLSSSAAVECAVICALDEIAGTGLSREAIAGLALRAEREFVGVPCGPMDQLAAMLAQPDRAVLIDTRTTETALVPLRIAEAGLTLLVLDTRVRHSLASSEYANRRAACERAAAALGVSALVDASPDAVEGLPDPELRARARHVLSEHQRVLDVVRLLGQGRVADIGPALTASHRSLADDFEVSCSELDVVVESALSAGALGARMIGAGFGGSAIALCHAAGADRVARAVEESYQSSGWSAPRMWPVRPAAGARRCSLR